MADKIYELSEKTDNIETKIELISKTITDLEDDVYGDLSIDEYFDDDDDDDDDDDLFEDFDDDDFDDDDMGHFEVQCPHCKEDVMVDFETLDMDKSMTCPNCHEEIEFEFEYDDCDCDECNHDDDDDLF